MRVYPQVRSSLTISGSPMSSALRDVPKLSRQMVRHFIDNVAPCGTLPGDALRGDVTAITRTCLELATSMLDGRNIPEKIEYLQEAARQWAREGIPIHTIHHAIHEGFKIGFDMVVTAAASKFRPPGSAADESTLALTTADFDSLMNGARLVVDMLDTMTSTVSTAYFHELRAVAGEHHTAVHTLTTALLSGRSTTVMARECGVEIANSYHVLAVAIGKHADEQNLRLNARVVARRKLRRLQAELATRCDETALSLLSIDGGTVLLPVTAHGCDLDELVGQLSRAADAPVTVTVAQSDPERIPHAANQAHELLDMVQRLQCAPGLYRFNDLALEFQLTRPGPGRESLARLLDPLDRHPEMLETLQRHIGNNFNRRRTARAMHVHTNTVDYRLRRIGQLTGLDPAEVYGLWYLRAALVARTYRNTDRRGA
ncbi:PucR family transcriptional regulator [Nocardia mexicana]|uniref:PucR-like helix-turn-helix protein n=1 Tax=Nocardia mexicana TaxID=279262 RepID=A0A370GWZ6_9NOCA|nr:helix-turn-helix domain-containing protein [Nocardia mexicana]RDI46433.1 PucR-like helix-turn-helix protein [Nocardia mexicana]